MICSRGDLSGKFPGGRVGKLVRDGRFSGFNSQGWAQGYFAVFFGRFPGGRTWYGNLLGGKIKNKPGLQGPDPKFFIFHTANTLSRRVAMGVEPQKLWAAVFSGIFRALEGDNTRKPNRRNLVWWGVPAAFPADFSPKRKGINIERLGRHGTDFFQLW